MEIVRGDEEVSTTCHVLNIIHKIPETVIHLYLLTVA